MINKVILIGNVGADPEVRSLEGGVKVARIRIATTERIYNRQSQEAREHTEWHSVTLWRNLADVADRFIRKGSQVYVEGRIRSRDWTDEAGNKRFAIEIMADDLKLLGRKQEGTGAPLSGTTYGAAPAGAPAQPSYGSPQPGGQPAYGAAPQPQQPAAPAAPAEDPDDLPF